MRGRLLASMICAGLALAARCHAEEATLELAGRDGAMVQLKLADLKSLPRTELEVDDRDGSTPILAGVELTHLLARAGAPAADQLRGEWLRCFVAIDAADGYRTVFSLAETDKSFLDRRIVLVYSRNGEALPAEQGPFQLIVENEKRHSRWVRRVTRIGIMDSLRPAAGEQDAKSPLVIKPEQSREHVGREVAVTFVVKAAKKSAHRKMVFLDSHEDFRDESNLGISLSEAAVESLILDKGILAPEDHFKGKQIRVTGKVALREGRPYIDVTDAGQIVEIVAEKPQP